MVSSKKKIKKIRGAGGNNNMQCLRTHARDMPSLFLKLPGKRGLGVWGS